MAGKAVRLRITGRVQGVGYRLWATRTAAGLRLRGWVRNQSDGSVELLATGAPEAVAALVEACATGVRPDAAELAMALEDRDRRLLFEIAFESAAPATWEEAQSCLAVLRRRRAEEELSAVQRQIESFAAAAGAAAGGELRRLLERKQELRRRLDPPRLESPH